MTDENLRLFRAALTEGLCNRIDKRIAECTESITTSAAHKRAMRKIINGTAEKGGFTLRKKTVIAILVAVALLLTGCAVIYREQICHFIHEIYDSFMTLETPDTADGEEHIGHIYELTYVPEGHVLDKICEDNSLIKSIFIKGEETIIFEQQLQRVNYLDSEKGYTKIMEANNQDVYYRYSLEQYHYFWNNDNYCFRLSSKLELSGEELEKIVIGLKKK